MSTNINQIINFLNLVIKGTTKEIIYYKYYFLIQNYLNKGKEKEVYCELKTILRQYANDLCVFVQNVHSENVLQLMLTNWKLFSRKLNTICGIFNTLENGYLKRNNLKTIKLFGNKLWRNLVFENKQSDTNKLLTNGILKEINKERMGKTIDRIQIKTLLQMTQEISEGTNYSNQYFEQSFLQNSKQYFKNNSALLLQNLGLGEYFQQVKKIMHQENLRISNYLFESLRTPLNEIIKKHYFYSRIKIIESKKVEWRKLIKEIQIEPLKSIYNFCLQNSHKKWFIAQFCKTITNMGLELVKQYENSINEIQDYTITREIINLRFIYQRLIKSDFANEPEMYTEGGKCFLYFLNYNSFCTRNLPKFIDFQLLQCHLKEEKQIENIFAGIIDVISFLHDKDLFKTYYVFYLSRRYILNLKNEFYEKRLVTEMKMKYGNSFTNKMDKIFEDIENSKHEDTNFQSFYLKRSKKKFPIKINPWIFKQSVWPEISQLECNMPIFLDNNLKVFYEYYDLIHPGRLLNWQYNAGFAKIDYYLNAQLTNGKCNNNITITLNENENGNNNNNIFKQQLLTSTFQMLIILLFNGQNPNLEVTFQDLLDNTGIPQFNLIGALIGLVSGNNPLLIRKRNENNTAISSNDIFLLNNTFVPQTKIIEIKRMPQNYTEKNKNSKTFLETEERKLLLMTMIVKILKKKKKIKKPDLFFILTELTKNRFKPSPNFIEQGIRSLIQREYIKMNKNILIYCP
ncbi:cullin [Anaeramoeba flamelloides]|uniref:Cullin n=1 Tax=Anaeramoeba flamelloides TaxID=1746091 RepID=A0ABQ8Z484_9EUKA|nr:cullin [Anaeramoeba flamelloides]